MSVSPWLFLLQSSILIFSINQCLFLLLTPILSYIGDVVRMEYCMRRQSIHSYLSDVILPQSNFESQLCKNFTLQTYVSLSLDLSFVSIAAILLSASHGA